MTLTFPDVSHHQETIDWTKFIYNVVAIKATQGSDIIDPEFQANRSGSRAVEFRFLYHFMDGSDPTAQAEWFCKTVGTLAPNEGIMLDMEGLTVSSWQDYYNAWTAYTKAHANRPVISVYTSDTDYHQISTTTDIRWVARYGSTPDNPAAIWQYTDTGTVSGISGDVDLSTTGYTVDNLLSIFGAPVVIPEAPTVNIEDDMYVFHKQSPDLYILTAGAITAIIAHSSPTVGNLKKNGAVFTVVDDDTYNSMEAQARKLSAAS